MMRLLLPSFVLVALLSIIAVGFVCRFYIINAGTLALKEGRGEIALKWLEIPARSGDRDAQLLVAYTYAYGWAGVERNNTKATRWFHRQGWSVPGSSRYPLAAVELQVARTFATGAGGVKIDLAESNRWFTQAARDGSPEAAKLMLRAQSPVKDGKVP